MTDNPDGDCGLAQRVFAAVQQTYARTGFIPARVAVRGPGSGAPSINFSCAVLSPANEVTCTSTQYDAQFLVSALHRGG